MTELALGGVDWTDVLKSIGSTTAVVAVIGYVAKSLAEQYLKRDAESYKAGLKREADIAITELKNRSAEQIAAAERDAQSALAGQRAEFDRQLEAFKSDDARRAARSDRIRSEIVRWSNPILGAVDDLSRRLHNILDKEGYLALCAGESDARNPEWSVDYDYFLPSTVFLFCQYFCWVRLLQEKLSFELFEQNVAKERFFLLVTNVGRTLSAFPLDELNGIRGTGDRQVFTLQQRGLGEILAVPDGTEQRCMRYSDFLMHWNDIEFRNRFASLLALIDGLKPTHRHRLERLKLMASALAELRTECEHLLSPRAV